MEPVSSCRPTEESGVYIKEEVIDPDCEDGQNRVIPKPVEIYLSDDHASMERDSSPKSCLVQNEDSLDPLASQISEEENGRRKTPPLPDSDFASRFQVEILEEVKQEIVWEEDEINITDNQLDCSNESPMKVYPPPTWICKQEVSIDDEETCNEPTYLRKSLRLIILGHHQLQQSVLEAESKELDEAQNIWSDNSDTDPDFSIVDEIKEETDRKKKSKCAVKRYKKSVKKRKINKTEKRIFCHKQTACFYCNRKFLQIVKHLQRIHSQEPDVKHLMTLEKGSDERRLAIRVIREKGNLNYNEEADLRDAEERRKNMKPKRVKKSKGNPGVFDPNKRIYNRNCCLYCKKKCFKIARHLEDIHNNEPDVQNFLTLKKGSKERLAAIQVIRKRGNYAHNREEIAGQKSLCNYCLGFYKKARLKKHIDRCPCNENAVQKMAEDGTPLRAKLSDQCTPSNIVNEKGNVELQREIRSKRAACYFCNKLATKLRQHLMMKHSEEPEVQHILSLEKGSKERYLAFQRIRKKGNFVHNKKVLNGEEGTFLTTRTHKSQNKTSDFLPCEYCFGYYKKHALIRHTVNCHFNKTPQEAKMKDIKEISENKRKKDLSKYCSSLMNCPTDSAESVAKIMSSFKIGKVMEIAKNDELVVKFGALIAEKRQSVSHSRRVMYNMRCLARLILRMNILDKSIKTLRDSLKTEKLKTLLKASVKLCASFKKRNAGLIENLLREAVKHCCMIVKSENLTLNNECKLREINEFLLLMKEVWCESLLPKMVQPIEAKQDLNNADSSIKRAGELPSTLGLENPRPVDDPIDSINDIEHCSDLLYRKKLICLFCQKSCFKLVLHWNGKHRHEPEIKRLAELEIGSKKRALFIKALRNKGSYFHNKRVIESGSGFLVRSKGRSVQKDYSDYLPCEYCLGFFRVDGLNRHSGHCPLKPPTEKNMQRRNRAKDFGVVALYVDKGGSKLLQKIIAQMKKDRPTSVLTNDELIMKFGEIIAEKDKDVPTVCKRTSLNMRELARLLINCQTFNSSLKSFRDCLQPANFTTILSAAKDKSLLQKSKKAAKNYFRRLGTLVQMCCKIVKSECLVEANETKLGDIVEFFSLFEKDWVLSKEDCSQICVSVKLPSQLSEELASNDSRSSKRLPKSAGRQIIKRRWTSEELNTVNNFFSICIKNYILPGKKEIDKCLKQNTVLEGRGWVSIKSKLRDIIEQEKINRKNNKVPATCDTSVHNNLATEHVLDPSAKIELHTEKRDITIAETVQGNCLSPPCSNTATRLNGNKDIIQSENEPDKNKPNSMSQTGAESENNRCADNPISNMKTNNQQDQGIDPINSVSVEEIDYCLNLISNNEQLVVDASHSKVIGDESHKKNLPALEKTVILTENQKSDDGVNGEHAERTYLLIGSSRWPPVESPAPNSVEPCRPVSENEPDTNESNSVSQTDAESENNITTSQPKETIRDSSLNNCSVNKLRLIRKKINAEESRYKKKGLNREWTEEENDVLFSYFEKHIRNRKIPSKFECEDCIHENDSLESRDWVCVKSKIYNIIRNKGKHKGKGSVGKRDSRPVFKEGSSDSSSSELVIDKSTNSDTKSYDKTKSINDETLSGSQDENATTLKVDTDSKVNENIKCKRKILKHPWTSEENKVIEDFFKLHIINNRVPGKKECENCIGQNSCLDSRSWVTVKSKVHNLIVSKKRKVSS